VAPEVRARDVENDPMARLKPLDAWGVNYAVLSVEIFQHLLRITQGLEAPSDGVQASALRTCKMVRDRADFPFIEWRRYSRERYCRWKRPR
jgi:hypothetical protein